MLSSYLKLSTGNTQWKQSKNIYLIRLSSKITSTPACVYVQGMRWGGNKVQAMPSMMTGSQIKFPAVCINFPKHRPTECATVPVADDDCLVPPSLPHIHMPRVCRLSSPSFSRSRPVANQQQLLPPSHLQRVRFGPAPTSSDTKKFPFRLHSSCSYSSCATALCILHAARLQRRIFA